MAITYKRSNIISGDMIGVPESVSDYLNEAARFDAPLVSRLGLGKVICTNPTHYYLELPWKPKRTTLATTVSDSDTTFVFSAAVFDAAERIVLNEEVILLGTTSDHITFSGSTRSVGTSSAAAHVAGEQAVGLGVGAYQGQAAGTTSDLTMQPSLVTTYTHIFKKDIVVSDTAKILSRYGVPMTQLDYQIEEQGRILMKEFEHRLFWDVATAHAASTVGAFDGLYERAVNASAYADLGGASVSLDNLETAVKIISDNGGFKNGYGLVMCGLYEKRIIDSLGLARVALQEPQNMLFGANVSGLLLGGINLDVIASSSLEANIFVLGNVEQLGIGPLQGNGGVDDFSITPLGKDGRREKYMLSGQYVFECPNPQCTYVLNSCKIS